MILSCRVSDWCVNVSASGSACVQDLEALSAFVLAPGSINTLVLIHRSLLHEPSHDYSDVLEI